VTPSLRAVVGYPYARIAVVAALATAFSASAARTQGAREPAVETDSTAVFPWMPEQVRSFLPERGRFIFPAPYGTEGIRVTNASDCGGSDCVLPVGGASWRNIDAHEGRDSMLIFLGLREVGPTLFRYDKRTGRTENIGPLFEPGSPFATRSGGEGWYFSARRPATLYLTSGTRLLRYDVLGRTFETVLDIATEFGEEREVGPAYSSDDDNVHSAALRDLASGALAGCLAYREDLRRFSFHAANGALAGCEVDKSGRWLVIKENADGVAGFDNRIVDLETGAETLLPGEDGAGGHTANGSGYIIATDNGRGRSGGVRVWRFDPNLPQGELVYGSASADGLDVGAIAHASAGPGVPLSQQHACAPATTTTTPAPAVEIVCFPLDPSGEVRPLAQGMAQPGTQRGASAPELPTGNLDVTGRYFLWVSHTGDRRDAFMVKVPAELLDTAPPQISGLGLASVTPTTARITWTTNEPADTRMDYGTTTAYGSSTTLNTSLVVLHSQSVSGLISGVLYHYRVRSRDEAGNLATSADFTFRTLDAASPSVSITTPRGGATVSGTVTVAANAADNVGVAGVQFKRNGVNIGAEDTAVPYSVSWNTTTAAAGSHSLTAVARDAAGNTKTSAGVTVTVANGGVVTLLPQDTFIKRDATNQSANAQLLTYTWPDHEVANAILMKFDPSSIPRAAVVTGATLQLALVGSDAAPESTYTVTAHKVVGRNPAIAAATGYTANGVTPWTPNACCSGGVPLAQADISAPYDSRAIGKAPGYKSWSIKAMAQEWVANPATNFGLLLNSDASRLRDRYRAFASMENANPSLRPFLRITYSLVPDTTWPHEPSGFVPTEETGWESGTLGNWYRIFQSVDKPITVKSIANSPLGESKALEIGYQAGHVGGGGTELRYDIPAALRRNEIFVGYHVQVNSQWQGHTSAINKMLYLHDGGDSFSAMWYEMFGSGSSPLGLYVVNQSGGTPAGIHENLTPVTFARGQWHKVEIYQKQGAANNGIVRVWVNGVLAINRSDVDTKAAPIDNLTISGIWGGVGDSKDQADYMRFDRIRISRPGP
jgi:Bacterial Ig domain